MVAEVVLVVLVSLWRGCEGERGEGKGGFLINKYFF